MTPTRIMISLRPAEAEALLALSEREDRHPRDQAARFLREGLRRAGVLEDAQPTEASRERELQPA